VLASNCDDLADKANSVADVPVDNEAECGNKGSEVDEEIGEWLAEEI